MNDITPLRSWLFAPGNRLTIMEKALAGKADAIILDLEDAVPRGEKMLARLAVTETVGRSDRANLFVRVNALSTDEAYRDLTTIIPAGPVGIVLPKAESAREVATADWLISQLEHEAGIQPGLIEIMPIIESAAGMMALDAIATASGRVRRLSFGAGDFTLDLALTWSRDEQELLSYRGQLVVASRAAGLEAPIDAVWVELADDEGMALSAARSRDHGFQGKLCIHPRQVDMVHAAFQPDAQALERARTIVSAAATTGGAATQVDGKMIDSPIVEAARRLLAEAAHRTASMSRSGAS